MKKKKQKTISINDHRFILFVGTPTQIVGFDRFGNSYTYNTLNLPRRKGKARNIDAI
jgi:hypothetical protein